MTSKSEKSREQDEITLELLDALEGMVEAYWRGSEDSDDANAPKCVRKAFAAIARATGEGQ